jgi:hypothetical protein
MQLQKWERFISSLWREYTTEIPPYNERKKEGGSETLFVKHF